MRCLSLINQPLYLFVLWPPMWYTGSSYIYRRLDVSLFIYIITWSHEGRVYEWWNKIREWKFRRFGEARKYMATCFKLHPHKNIKSFNAGNTFHITSFPHKESPVVTLSLISIFFPIHPFISYGFLVHPFILPILDEQFFHSSWTNSSINQIDIFLLPTHLLPL